MNQYDEDIKRIAVLLKKYAGIPEKKILSFLESSDISDLQARSSMVCSNNAQRTKLSEIFEIKNLYLAIEKTVSQKYCLNSPHAAAEYFRNNFKDKGDKERLVVAYLDSSLKVLATKVAFEGTVNETAVYPREVVKEALFQNASRIIVSHNHPGEITVPSNADIEMTNTLRSALATVNIELADHIVVTKNDYVSLKENHFSSDKNEFVKERAVNEKPVKSYRSYENTPSMIATIKRKGRERKARRIGRSL